MADTSGFNAPLTPAQQAATGEQTVAQLFNAQAAANNNGQTGLQLWQAQNGGSGGSTVTPPPTNGVTQDQLRQAMNNVQTAIANGDQRSYDLAVAQLMGIFQGQNTQSQQQALGFDNSGKPFLNTSEQLGYITMPDGTKVPTLDASKQAEAQREFNLNTAGNLLDTASKLSGPQNWGQYEQYIHGGKSLYNQAMSGAPASGAPVGQNQPQTLASLMSAFGMGGAPSAAQAQAAGSQQNLYRQIMGLSTDYAPGTQYTAADVKASPSYQQAAANGFSTYGGNDPLGGAGGGGSDPMDPTGTASDQGLYNEQGTYRQLMGLSQDWNPNTNFTPVDVRNSGAYQNAQAGGFATFGGVDPLAIKTTGINNTGQSAQNQDLLNSLGFSAPNLSQNDLNRLAGAQAGQNATTSDVLNSANYREMTNGSPTDAGVQAMQTYERSLQALNNPGQMNPAFWDSLGKNGQQLWLNAAQQVFGWDPNDYVAQINATRPLGSPLIPQSTATHYSAVGA